MRKLEHAPGPTFRGPWPKQHAPTLVSQLEKVMMPPYALLHVVSKTDSPIPLSILSLI